MSLPIHIGPRALATAQALMAAPKAPTGKAQTKRAQKFTIASYLKTRPGTLGDAIAGLLHDAMTGLLPAPIATALAALRGAKQAALPSRGTLYRWCQEHGACLLGNADAGTPKHKGRPRREWGWEVRALQLYQRPTKPSMGTVAFWLRQEGFDTATDTRVRCFLQSAPATLGPQSPIRMGKHYYDQNLRRHVIRDASVLPVGFVYEGDGHCCDFYIEHPRTGCPYRPELTVWIDVRSHYIVGWWLSETESALSTLFSLSHAFVCQNHVCAIVHTDPGSGFRARLISDEESGFLARFGIDPLVALPGNAKGKGLTEGWFRIFEERVGKQQVTYCGHDRSDDYLRYLTRKVQRGDIVLPTFIECRDFIAAGIHAHNREPQDGIGCAPAELWARLERVPPGITADAMLRPRDKRIVQRWRVRLDNRVYEHPDLAHKNNAEVLVEYSLHDDAHVTVLDLQGRFICIANLVAKTPWLPSDRIEAAEQRRATARIQRLQVHAEEASARALRLAPIDQVAASVPAPSPAAIERVAAALANDDLPADDDPMAQHMAWLDIGARIDAGDASVSDAERQGYAIYRTSRDFTRRQRFLDEFGAQPG